MAIKKYAKHVLPLPTRNPNERPGGPVGYTWEGIYAHKDQLGGANCTVVFYYITETFEEGPPHRHNAKISRVSGSGQAASTAAASAGVT